LDVFTHVELRAGRFVEVGLLMGMFVEVGLQRGRFVEAYYILKAMVEQDHNVFGYASLI